MTSGRNSLSSISKLKGIGPKVSESLLRLNIQTIEDALFHLPYRYEDRTKITHVADALEGVTGLFQGEITSCQVVFRGRRMLIVELYDGTGSFKIRMFHFAMAQKNNLSIGKIVRCYGTLHHRPNGKELIHPTYQVFNKDHIPNIENSFTPIYPTTDNLQQGRLRNLIRQSRIFRLLFSNMFYFNFSGILLFIRKVNLYTFLYLFFS